MCRYNNDAGEENEPSHFAEEILACDHLADAIRLEDEIRRDQTRRLELLLQQKILEEHGY